MAGPGVPSDIFARYHRLRGNDVLMVSGTDEHGTPVMVSADREGVSPRELADRNNALILDDYVKLGLAFDTFTRTTTRQPLRRHAGHLPHAAREGLPHRAHDARRVLPPDGPDAARPLHRGHVPDLRLPGRARRPVRQLRQPARSRRPHRAALDHRRLDAGVPRDDAPVPRPARVRDAARGMADGADALAAERPQLLARARPRAQAARDDARHRLGRSRAGSRLPRGHEAHLRLVRRRHRLPVGEHRVGAQPRHAGGLARVVAERRVAPLLLHGQGQHRLPRRHLAGDAHRLRRRPAAAVQRRRERVPDDGGQEGVDEPERRHLGARLPQPLRPGPAPLLPHRRRAGDAGHRLHVGRVRAPQQRRAARELGQPRQPDARERAPALRRRPRARPARRGGHEGARRGRGRVRPRRRAHRGRPLQGRARRGDARVRRREPVHRRPGAVGAREDRPRPRRDGALRRAPLRRLAEDAVRAVPALHVADGARAARLRRLDRRPARDPPQGGRGSTDVLTGDYASWVGTWAPSEIPPGQQLREPKPLFRKLPPETAAEELARLGIEQQ